MDLKRNMNMDLITVEFKYLKIWFSVEKLLSSMRRNTITRHFIFESGTLKSNMHVKSF